MACDINQFGDSSDNEANRKAANMAFAPILGNEFFDEDDRPFLVGSKLKMPSGKVVKLIGFFIRTYRDQRVQHIGEVQINFGFQERVRIMVPLRDLKYL